MKTKFNQRVLGNARTIIAITTLLMLCAGCTNDTNTPQSLEKQALTPSPTVSAPESTPQAKQTPTLLESKDISIGALVKKTGLDFSYETPGRVQERNKVIVINYIYSKKCSGDTPGGTFTQERESVFDLRSKTWTDKARELSNCLGTQNPEWINTSDDPSRFSVESSGTETVIRADALDSDGSVILKDKLVVKYTRPESSAPLEEQATLAPNEPVSSTSSVSSQAILTATDPDSQINLRKTPEASGKYLGYGLVGDRVEVTEQTTGTDNDTWYKVHFPKSDARGWIHGKFVNVVSTNETSQPASETSDYSSETTSETSSYPIYSASSGSSGRCNSPDDIDSAGHRCGGRSASSRRRRR